MSDDDLKPRLRLRLSSEAEPDFDSCQSSTSAWLSAGSSPEGWLKPSAAPRLASLFEQLGAPPEYANALRPRLQRRDEAYQALAELLDPRGTINARVGTVAARVASYLRSAWRVDRDNGAPPRGADAIRNALFALATASGGRKISRSQLQSVLRGQRNR